MEVTRNVILDLLPLYLAGEVSPDSSKLVEKYLQTDPELARLAERTAAINLSEEVPIPITQEDQMEAYKEAKRLMFWRTVVVAGLIVFGLVFVLVMVLAAGAFLYSS
jgi:anti-sigma factor RsiW